MKASVSNNNKLNPFTWYYCAFFSQIHIFFIMRENSKIYIYKKNSAIKWYIFVVLNIWQFVVVKWACYSKYNKKGWNVASFSNQTLILFSFSSNFSLLCFPIFTFFFYLNIISFVSKSQMDSLLFLQDIFPSKHGKTVSSVSQTYWSKAICFFFFPSLSLSLSLSLYFFYIYPNCCCLNK